MRVSVEVKPPQETGDSKGPSTIALRVPLLHLGDVPRDVLNGYWVFHCQTVGLAFYLGSAKYSTFLAKPGLVHYALHVMYKLQVYLASARTTERVVRVSSCRAFRYATLSISASHSLSWKSLCACVVVAKINNVKMEKI